MPAEVLLCLVGRSDCLPACLTHCPSQPALHSLTFSGQCADPLSSFFICSIFIFIFFSFPVFALLLMTSTTTAVVFTFIHIHTHSGHYANLIGSSCLIFPSSLLLLHTPDLIRSFSHFSPFHRSVSRFISIFGVGCTIHSLVHSLLTVISDVDARTHQR